MAKLKQVVEELDPAIGALAGVSPIGGAIYGAIKNAKAVRAKETEIDKYETDIDAWYDKNYNQDYLSTNLGRSALERTREQILNQNKVADNNAVVTGATPEASLAAKTANNEMYSDIVNKLSAMGTARQDRADAINRQQKLGLFNTNMGMRDADIASAQQFQKNSGDQMKSIMNLAAKLGTGGV
jgi:hypothetical protein